MAHKTLIGGTAYEISGGKTLVDGTAYSIKNGKTLVGGTVYEVGFANHLSPDGEILDTWADIQAGLYTEFYSIGNYKPITLTTGETINMEIVAFNADTKADGSKAAITWISREIATNHSMNSTATNVDGWAASKMRTWLKDGFYATLPIEVKAVIQTVNKTYYDSTTTSTLTCEDNVWIPSYREIYGSDARETSGVDYTAYFSSEAMCQKKNLRGNPASWWLRSAYISGAIVFCLVNIAGGVATSRANESCGVVLGFCT